MLSKLAIRNSKRSIKDYAIYLLTVALAFSLIFSFNLIIFSEDILELSSFMKNFKMSIFVVSSVIIFVIGWLIHYTMKFMLEKRSKEFGTYMLLGIEKKQITKMFLLENLFLGLFALFISIFIGFGISQLMTMIIMKIFELPYIINFSFKAETIYLTIMYFCIIYLFVLFKARKKIKKMKLYDLLYFEKQNEKKIYKNTNKRTISFVIYFCLGIFALWLFQFVFATLMANINDGIAMPCMLLGFILLIISIYGVTMTFADFITNLVIKNKKIKYSKDNLFIVRQFSSKVRTMGATMGTLSLLITLTLICLNVSNVFNEMFKNKNESAAPYDILLYNFYSETDESVGDKVTTSAEQYMEYIKEYYTIKDEVNYKVYTELKDDVRKHISDGVTGYQRFDCYLKLSDYNKLLKMRGIEEISLNNDQFYIHSFRDVSKELKKYFEDKKELTIGNKKLSLSAMTDYKYSTSWSRGSSYIIVVSDDIITGDFKIVNTMAAINTVEKTTEDFYNQINDKFPPTIIHSETEQGYDMQYSIRTVTVKGAVDAENRSFITIISFSLMYLSFIFIAVVGTILAIQSLSDSTKYRYRYTLLKKLGMEEYQIYKTVRKQLLLNFSLPIIYPIIVSVITSNSLNLIFNFYMESDATIMITVILNVLLFLIIYAIYFISTYYNFKNNIKGN